MFGTSKSFVAIALTVIRLVVDFGTVCGHGRLLEPPSRSSAWRFGFNTTKNYNDHELYCGGFTRQWVQNDGKCGICGDAYDLKEPRPNEIGGIYGSGIIVRTYDSQKSHEIPIKIELTAYHKGHFEFSICPDPYDNTQECFDLYKLSAVSGDRFYYPLNGNAVYSMRYRLPASLNHCQHCVLQWKYKAGNNWGQCSNGTEAIGCGPQEEFRGCADIRIKFGSSSDSDSDSDGHDHTNYSFKTILQIILFTLIGAICVFAALFIKYYDLYDKFKRQLQVYNLFDKIYKLSSRG